MHNAIERADIEVLKKKVPRKQLALVDDGSGDHDHRADANVAVATPISEKIYDLTQLRKTRQNTAKSDIDTLAPP